MPGISDSSATVRRASIGLVVLLAVVLVLLSPQFGRAHPEGSYRPVLDPPALELGCYPLPEGLTLDFAHQVRTDGDVEVDGEPRRELVVQYDLIDDDEVREQLTASFVEAGFTPETGAGDALVFTRPDTGPVSVEVEPLPDVPEDATVRGTVTFDLPSVPLASDDPICDDPYATKRFPDSYELAR
ncbi:hypothetical protein [Nocardioides sp. cx-173]|uniref:hypothetical protein n=1 Tax=Nocardioides sp. cx-173 TaxID=2898796 RepID=UPI001E57CBA5|nr:hypothetical protein [Nocardioides sp. cx-173]MCD4525286.1 hypothetical protein [Nocardioides sp. cx-173]UGB40913.1 hypothetical protein LQ940_16235 [Nocardioides sp. cx-173]